LILHKTSTITNIYNGNQEKVTATKRYTLLRAQKQQIRTHFYDKDIWLLRPGYYILSDTFLEKKKINK